MKDWIILALNSEPSEFDADRFQILNELVGGLGIKFDVVEKQNTHLLKISYDRDVVKKKVKRNAGAKRKYISRSVPVAEIRSRMETETAEQIAKSLGISRPTLFRKLKYAEEWGYDYIM